MDSPSEYAHFFAGLSRELMSDGEEAPTFTHVVRSAVEVVGPCDMAGISLLRRRRIDSVAATEPLVEQLDELQHTLGEGPCVDAALHQEFYLADDLGEESRWPRWSRAAHDLGVESVLSVRLSTEDESLGALNFYSRRQGVWDQDDVDVALVFAAHAANAMVSARLVAGLTTAVNRRHAIGVAEGVLMARHRLEVDDAFELMTALAQRHDIPMHVLAEMIIREKGLPARLATDLPS